MALVDILIPTCGRKTGVAMVLASLLGQTFSDFDVIISDQTPDVDYYGDSIEIQTALRALEWHGHHVQWHPLSFPSKTMHLLNPDSQLSGCTDIELPRPFSTLKHSGHHSCADVNPRLLH